MPKPSKTVTDYVVVAFSPVLIMLLVGSLAFFLIQVFYRGPMVHGIRWLMFWFVLAIVLVSRIGIEQGKVHAWIYGGALAVVTWLYLAHTHGMGVLGAILLAIPWWCAHQLTVDCTLIREDEDASGEGVLQSLLSRLERTIDPPQPPPLLASLSPLDALVAENLAKRRARKSPRPPGRTVVWFSLAALPLFGFGQLFLPADDPHARRVGFAFLAVYLAAALGLLATTSFLGLRRYLRQRSAEMPSSVTLAWMKFALFLAGGVLLLALILPRPANHTWKDLVYRIEPKPHKANDIAPPFNPPGEGDGMPSDAPVDRAQRAPDSPKPASSSGGSSPRRDSRPQPNSASKPDDAPQSSGGGGGRGGSEGKVGDQGQNDQGGDKEGGPAEKTPPPTSIKLKDMTGSLKGNDPGGESPSPGGKEAEKTSREREADGNGHVTADPSQDHSQSKDSDREPKDKKRPAQEKPPQEQEPPNPGTSQPQPNPFWATLLRILALIALAALLLWALIRYRKVLADMLRSLMNSIREFFRKLLSIRWRRKSKKEPVAADPVPVLEPFATYENPFATGKDKAWSSERLLSYTYEAVCAWAKEQHIAMRPQETPREFCLRLLGNFPDFGEDLEQFSTYYTHLAFAQRLPRDFETDSLRRLWQSLGDAITLSQARF